MQLELQMGIGAGAHNTSNYGVNKGSKQLAKYQWSVIKYMSSVIESIEFGNWADLTLGHFLQLFL